jgi:hypothetical protein
MAIQPLDWLGAPSASAQGLSLSNGLSLSKRLDCFVAPLLAMTEVATEKLKPL